MFDEADQLLIGDNGELIGRIMHHLINFKYDESNPCLPPCLHSFQLKESSHFNPLVLEPTSQQPEHINLEMKKEKLLSEYIYTALPPLQRLLFSATLTKDPEHLQNVSLYQPILFTTDKCKHFLFIHSF